ncbi:MAG: hypothetical protein IIY55_04160 [Blautia sp.]|nr:hypothetical protein [Blautia sp.]
MKALNEKGMERRLNIMQEKRTLLIIGAGEHGKVVEEIAILSHAYEEIAFVDDDTSKDEKVIGDLKNLERYIDSFTDCIVSLGNNELRAGLLRKIEQIGYHIPILIHPDASVSPSAKIGAGTVIEANAAVNSNAVIGKGCLLSIGALVDHNGVVEDYCHLDAGAVVKTHGSVSVGSHIDSGGVVESGSVTKAVSVTPDINNEEEWVREYLKERGTMPTFF